MKKTASALAAVTIALALTGCAPAADATGGKNVVRDITAASDVATTLIVKELAKNLPATLGEVTDVAETLIDNATKE